jgi:hypothetical protein
VVHVDVLSQRPYACGMEKSTRLSIVEHALADVADRLQELPPTTDAERLRKLAARYQTEVEIWREHPPDEAQRSSLLRAVLDLDVELMRAGAPARKKEEEEGEGDEDYPKPV